MDVPGWTSLQSVHTAYVSELVGRPRIHGTSLFVSIQKG